MRKPHAKKAGLLLVEDDPVQAECCKRLLEEYYDVFAAPNTEEAEKILARNPGLQILLCDQEMEGEQGLEYCRRLQSRKSPLIRILITGHSEPTFLMEAINSKALFHYVLKPYERNDLLEILHLAETAYKERQTALEAQEELHSRTPQNSSIVKKLVYWAQMIIGIGSMVFVTLLILAAITAAVGLTVILGLYFLKSFLGIDVFKDSHLSDWF